MSEKDSKEGRNSKGQFAKGNQLAKGHGHGRPKLSEEEKALSLATRTQFKVLLQKYSSWTYAEVCKHLEKCVGLPIIDTAVLQHLKSTHESGSMERVDWTLDHIMGSRPKESVVTVNQGTKKLDLTKMSKEELAELRKIVQRQEAINDESE